MRAFTVKAKSLKSAKILSEALRRFDPALHGNSNEGYSVSVDVDAEKRRLLEVLHAIHQHVHERDDPAGVELDEKTYTVLPELGLARPRAQAVKRRRAARAARGDGASSPSPPSTSRRRPGSSSR